MKKRILSLVLAVIMALSVMPFSVFAEESNQEQTQAQAESVTGYNDTANYLLKVPDNAACYTNNLGGYVGWGSSTICKNTKGAYASGNGAGLFTVEKDGDYYIEFDYNDDNEGEANVSINYNAFTYGPAYKDVYGSAGNFDMSKMTHFAFRIKTEGFSEGDQAVFGIYKGEYSTFFSLSTAYFIDYNTREIRRDLEYVPNGLIIKENLDGWLVAPISKLWGLKTITYTDAEGVEQSYSITAKEFLLGTAEARNGETNAAAPSFQLWFHNYGTEGKTDCKHISVNSNWTQKNLYLGDILMFEDEDAFNSVYAGCDVHGHVLSENIETVAPTCTEAGYTGYTCKYCDYAKNKVITEAAKGHDYNTVTIDATTGQKGYDLHVCNICSASYKDNYTQPTGKQDKLRMAFYHFASYTTNYTTDGVNTDADNLKEFEDVIAQGYLNTVTLSTSKLFKEKVAICRKYGVEFWIGPGLFNSSKQTIELYINNVQKQIDVIRDADAWDIFLGFHWDEPIWNGQKNEDYLAMTRALVEKWNKRTFPVFALGSFMDKYYANEEDRKTDIITKESMAYTTDAGWDSYSWDMTEEAKLNDRQNLSLLNTSIKYGVELKTAKDYYRFVHSQMLRFFDHEVTSWFFPCAYIRGASTGKTTDEAFMIGQVEGFRDILLEQDNPGGIFLYTYTTWSSAGIEQFLEVPNLETGEQLLYPEVEKWHDYSETLKEITAEFNNTPAYIHETCPFGVIDVTEKTANSITIHAVEDYEFSIDGGKNWIFGGTFENLTPETAYTITSRNILNGKTRDFVVATRAEKPFASGLEDTASYIIKMPYDLKYFSNSFGWAGTHIGRTYDDTAWAEGDSGVLFFKDIDGERMLEVHKEPGYESSIVLNPALSDPLRAKSDTGFSSELDTTNLSGFVYRVKTEGGDETVNSTLTFYINHRGISGKCYYIDKNRNVTEFNGAVKITKNIDGWIIIPFDSYTTLDSTMTNKEWLIENYSGVQVWLHDAGCNHGTTSSWGERILYVGDIMVYEDLETYIDAHTYPDEILSAEVCTDYIAVASTDGNIEYSIDGINWQESGEFKNLKANTTYTVLAKHKNSELTISKEITTTANHAYHAKVTAPTCTSQGFTTMTCTRCGYETVVNYKDPIPHTYIENPEKEVFASCEEGGYKVYECVCGDYYTFETDVPTGHTYIELSRIPATCQKAGYYETGCENCDYYTITALEKVDHNFVAGKVVAPTPNSQGYTIYTCDMCGSTENRDFTDYVKPTNRVDGIVLTPDDVSVTVSWNAFEGATGYYVRVRDINNTKTLKNIQVKSGTTAKFTTEILEYNTEYIFQVIAYVGSAYQSWNDAESVVGSMVIGDRVVGLKATIQGKGAVISFLPVEGAQGYYAAVYLEDGTRHASIPINDANATSVTVINNLYAGTKYTVKITPKLNGSYVPFANCLSVAFTAPVVNPTSYTIADQTATSVRFSWDAVRGVQEYFIRVKEKETGAAVKTIHVTGGKTTATLARYTDGSPLKSETTYTFEFCAYIPGMPISYSAPVDFTTIAFEDVTIKATFAGVSKLKLTWNATSNAYAYYLYRIDSTGKKTYFKYLDAATTSITIDTPSVAGKYTFGVVTVERNTSGTSYVPMAVSNSVTIK